MGLSSICVPSLLGIIGAYNNSYLSLGLDGGDLLASLPLMNDSNLVCDELVPMSPEVGRNLAELPMHCDEKEQRSKQILAVFQRPSPMVSKAPRRPHIGPWYRRDFLPSSPQVFEKIQSARRSRAKKFVRPCRTLGWSDFVQHRHILRITFY